MPFIVTDVGEEYVSRTDLDGVTLTIGLYNESTDTIFDANDIGAITTEPTGSTYSRQSSTFSSTKIGGDWGIENDTKLRFDVSDSSQTVDAVFYTATFQSVEAGDSSPQTHCIATAELTQTRNLSQLDLLDIAASDITLTVD
jgi:hypothetical protein